MELSEKQKSTLLQLASMGQKLASMQKDLLDLQTLIINSGYCIPETSMEFLNKRCDEIDIMQIGLNCYVWNCEHDL